MGDDDGGIEIDGTIFNKEQIERQTQRIFDVVFVNGSTVGETYGGSLHPDLSEILSSAIPVDVQLEGEHLTEIFEGIGESFGDWIQKNVKSVHPAVIGAFLIDFIPTCISSFFQVEEVTPPSSDYDPSYA